MKVKKNVEKNEKKWGWTKRKKCYEHKRLSLQKVTKEKYMRVEAKRKKKELNEKKEWMKRMELSGMSWEGKSKAWCWVNSS